MANLLVHVLHPDADGFPRRALQVHIQRGVDAEGVGLEVRVLDPGLQLVVHQVDEVRRLHRLRGGLGHGQRRLARERVIAFAEEPVLPHQAQHHVAPLPQAVGMVERVVQSGPLDHAGELRSLRQ